MARHETTRTDSARDDGTIPATGLDIPGVDGSTTATVIATDRPDAPDATFPNELTIVGRDTPSSFEITVDGAIDPEDATNATDATVVSGTTVEGTIETGTVSFRFDGDLVDVTFVDRSIAGRAPGTVPNVHVDYGSSE